MAQQTVKTWKELAGGFMGAMQDSEITCEQCAQAGHKTNGGYAPTLKQDAKGNLYCMSTHGQVKVN